MKSRIPKFRSLTEERAFWQTHSATDFLDELTPVVLEFGGPSSRKQSPSVKLSGVEVRILQGVLARLLHAQHRSSSHSPASHKG